jgi:RHS repeat-associated protein
LGFTQTTSYDAVGNIVATTDALGHTTTYTYDTLDRLSAVTDALGQTTRYAYDAVGNRVRAIDALGRTNNYVYDAFDRQIAAIDPLGHVTRTTFDLVGNRTSVTDALGHSTYYQYDSNGNLINVRENIEVASQQQRSTFDLYAPTEPSGAYSIFATGDINGDGIDDIVTTVSSGDNNKLNVLLGGTTTPLASKYTISTLPIDNASAIDRLELKDVDGDGKLDLIAKLRYDMFSSAGAIFVFHNQGDGIFSAPESLTVDGHSDGFVTGDFNGDGKLDILAYSNPINNTCGSTISPTTSSDLVLFAGDGLGSFTQQAIDIPLTDPTTNPIVSLKTIEIGGKTDLIVNSDNELVVFDRDVNGIWHDIYRNVSDFYTDRSQVVVGDLNGDGIADIITAGDSNQLQLLFGSNDGSFSAQTFDPSDNDLKSIDYLNLADINKDGKLDLIVGRTKLTYDYYQDSYLENSFLIKVYDVNSDGYLSQLGTTKIVNNLPKLDRQFAGMADIDGDGNQDILIKFSGSSNSIGVFREYSTTSYTLSTFGSKSYTYDALDRQISSTDALGRTTSYAYDQLNRQVATIDPLGQTKSVGYDAVDNIVGLTDKLGQLTAFTYDALNRRTKITDPLGNAQTTVYDSVGNTLTVTDALGSTNAYAYDALNRNIKVTDAKGGITRTGYDAVGNLTYLTDAVGNKTTYAYDALDRVITDTNQLGFSRNYTYDAVGNQIALVDRNGRKTTYSYDKLNRNTAENWIGNTGTSIRSISYTYDAVGNLVTQSDLDSKYTYAYDAVNRTTSIDNTGTTGVPAVIFSYAYDAVNNLVSVADSINGTSAGQTNYTYDSLNRTTKITQSGTGVQNKRVDMTYNKVDRPTSLTRFSDLSGTNLVATTTYTYDQNQKLVQLAHTKGATNLDSFNYTYDAAHRLIKTTSTFDGSEDYTYDATNQLTGATHTSQADEAFQYDANGNRTDGGYQTGVDNRLLTDGKFNYQYDQEGNRTKRTEISTGKVTEYVWDYHNRLTSVLFKDAGGSVTKTIGYTYDLNNQRIGKNVDGAVERYVIDGNQIALVFDGAGVQKSRYLYGTGVDQVLAEETGANLLWFLADEQGTIKDVVDNTGTLIDHVSYDSLGRIVNQTNPLDLRFAYTGREWDGESGQYYYRARYYDPTVGRFISQDPLGFGAGDTNIYRYVGNSFVNATDPSGLCSSDSSWWNRALGGLQLIGGLAQTTAGIGLAGAGTAGSGGVAAIPSTIAGTAIAARGLDDVQAGLRQLVTGQQTNTLTYDAVKNLTGNENLATVVDIGTGLIGPGAAAKGAAAAKEAEAVAAAARAERAAAAAAARAEAEAAEVVAAQARAAGNASGLNYPSTSVGKRGAPLEVLPGSNKPSNIGGRDYSGHALDRMQGRGLPSSVIENTIQNGIATPGNRAGTTLHYDEINRVSVVTDTASGTVITVITK